MALISDIILAPDTRANQPAATAVATGSIYFVTDEGVIERSNGTTWDQYSISDAEVLAAVLAALAAVTFVTTSDETGDLAASRQLVAGSGITVNTATPGQVEISTSGVAAGGDWNYFERCTIFFNRVSAAGAMEAVGAQSTMAGLGTNSIQLSGQQMYSQWLSSAAAGSQFGVLSAISWVYPDAYPQLDVIVRSPNDLTDVRMFVGFLSTTPSNADDPPNNSAVFRFSSVAGDTGWRPVTRDGATTDVGANIGTVVANTLYSLRIRFDASGVHFSVDGGSETTLNTNVPTAGVLLGFGARGFAVVASARSLGVARGRVIYGSAAPGF